MLAEVRQTLFEQSSQPPVVLLIADGDIERRMLISLLRREGCKSIAVRSCAEGLDMLAASRPDLVVLFRDMRGMDVLECCRNIKASRRNELTPVMIVSGGASVSDEIAGIQAGADEYLITPLHPEVFRARIRAMLRHKVATDRLEEAETILFALAQAVEKRDHTTGGHCQRLALFSVAFGMRLGLSQVQLLALHRGGFLHDIGKIAIPDSILFKPGKLTPEEWTVMKTHSVRGEEVCKPLRSLSHVLPIVRNHHERWDGGGYPDGLRGSKVPLLARVLQLTDVYDALTTVRPYKPAYTTQVALETLVAEAKMGWRDPELTELFTQLPFDTLDAAAHKAMDAEHAQNFEESIVNLKTHLLAVAS